MRPFFKYINNVNDLSHFISELFLEMVRELLPYISASTPSQPPLTTMTAFIKELGTESGLTPLVEIILIILANSAIN